MNTYFKIRWAFLCVIFSINIIFWSKISAQTEINTKTNFKERSESTELQTEFIPNGIPKNRRSLFVLKVQEIADSFKHFTVSSGSHFGYCGDIEGGIRNILGTFISSSPNVRFLNISNRKRYVFFYGEGFNMSTFYQDDTTKSKCDIVYVVDGREILLNVLKNDFDFSIEKTIDSLPVYEIIEQDHEKLYSFYTPFRASDSLFYGSIYSPTPKSIVQKNMHLYFLSELFEYKWNTYFEIDKKIKPDYFKIKIPTHFFDSEEKYYELKQYLEENYGLTIFKKKRLEKVYLIKFNNGQ